MTKKKNEKTERLIPEEGGPTHKEVKKPGLFGGFFDRFSKEKTGPEPRNDDDNNYKPM